MTELSQPPDNTAESKAAPNQGGNGSKVASPFPLKTAPSRPTVFTSNYTPLGRFNALFSGIVRPGRA